LLETIKAELFLQWLQRRAGAFWTDEDSVASSNRDKGEFQRSGGELSCCQNGDFWVFGYGSLMWKPGFDFLESALADVQGYHRSLCIFSHVHRGTPERPGLVLGLDHGGSCQGVAFRVAARKREETLAYLRERELVTSVYFEKTLNVRFAEGSSVPALAYVVDREHEQYAGRLPLDEVTRLVSGAKGAFGDNPAYVRNTYEHLLRLDIHDEELAAVTRRLDAVSCRVKPLRAAE
jgi:cation transport protein ChaC